MDFSTRVGSFKILSVNDKNKARGTLTMSFNGSVLIVGLEGTVTPGGGVREEYNDPKHERQCFFGKGTLSITGKWRAIQFFGRDFSGRWNGFGVARLYGEFDDKLETGTYTIQGFDSEPWGSGGRTIILPREKTGQQLGKPKVEDVKKKPG